MVRYLGKEFYHIEMESIDLIRKLLAASPLDLRGTKFVFYA